MLTLFHHPFCPHSRFVRLALGEYGIEARLSRSGSGSGGEDFLVLNPAGTTPVLVDEGQPRSRARRPSPNISTRRTAPNAGERRLCRTRPARGSRSAG